MLFHYNSRPFFTLRFNRKNPITTSHKTRAIIDKFIGVTMSIKSRIMHSAKSLRATSVSIASSIATRNFANSFCDYFFSTKNRTMNLISIFGFKSIITIWANFYRNWKILKGIWIAVSFPSTIMKSAISTSDRFLKTTFNHTNFDKIIFHTFKYTTLSNKCQEIARSAN